MDRSTGSVYPPGGRAAWNLSDSESGDAQTSVELKTKPPFCQGNTPAMPTRKHAAVVNNVNVRRRLGPAEPSRGSGSVEFSEMGAVGELALFSVASSRNHIKTPAEWLAPWCSAFHRGSWFHMRFQLRPKGAKTATLMNRKSPQTKAIYNSLCNRQVPGSSPGLGSISFNSRARCLPV